MTSNGSHTPSNCLPDRPGGFARIEQEQYMTANFSRLSKEVAQGSGDSVEGLAEILGCEQSSSADFAKTLQASHDTIFSQPGSIAALEAVRSSVSSKPELLSKCTSVAFDEPELMAQSPSTEESL